MSGTKHNYYECPDDETKQRKRLRDSSFEASWRNSQKNKEEFFKDWIEELKNELSELKSKCSMAECVLLEQKEDEIAGLKEKIMRLEAGIEDLRAGYKAMKTENDKDEIITEFIHQNDRSIRSIDKLIRDLERAENGKMDLHGYYVVSINLYDIKNILDEIRGCYWLKKQICKELE